MFGPSSAFAVWKASMAAWCFFKRQWGFIVLAFMGSRVSGRGASGFEKWE